jgi:hypothetical protein
MIGAPQILKQPGAPEKFALELRIDL